MSKLKVINNYASNDSPYKLFSSSKNFENEMKAFSNSALTPHNLPNNKNKSNYNFYPRAFSSKTRDDREVSLISKNMKSMTLSNESYSNYINYYFNLTQDHTFKTPRISNYPIRKNEQYLSITSQQNIGSFITSGRGQDSIFESFLRDSEQKKTMEKKPYGFKYGNTKIRLRPKTTNHTINPKVFQNLCETNIFESELLNQIGLKNIDMYNSLDEKNKNFKYFNDYLEKFNNVNIKDCFIDDNSYKSIKFNARTAIIKKTINYKLEIFSLNLKFYLLGNKTKPQKLFFPFKLLPIFYLLDFQIFKVFLSEIIYYDNKKDCFSFIQNDLLIEKIRKYYNFISKTTKNDSKYLNYITYNKNELLFYLSYDWVVSNADNYNCYKLKITLPKIKFHIDNYQIKIIKHLDKHIIANLIMNNFKDWEKFILFDLFSNKRFKNIAHLIMINKHNSIKTNKIFLNKDPNNEPVNNKKYEFYLSENGKNFSNFYIFVPYIILVLCGENNKKYKKIHLNWKESKNLIKLKPYWGIINTLLKCMFIDSNTNEICFRLDLLDNIENYLFQIIIQENSNLKLNSVKNQNVHNLACIRNNSSKNNLLHKDKDKDKNKTKYKTNNLEISLLECSFKTLSILDNTLESKYLKIPEKFHKCIFSLKEEKDLFNTNYNDISEIGKCIGECSNSILNSLEENIINEIQLMKKKAKDIPLAKSNEKFLSSSPKAINKVVPNKFNKLKTFKLSSNSPFENFSNKLLKRKKEKKESKRKSKLEIGEKAILEEKKRKNETMNLHNSQKFIIKFGMEYKGYREISNRKVTITSSNQLNKERINFQYIDRNEYIKKITSKY